MKLRHNILQLPKLPPPRTKDESQYETIEEAMMNRNSIISNKAALEEEFSLTSCEAYETHKPIITKALDYEVAITTQADGDMYVTIDDNTEQKAIKTKTDVNYYVSMDGTKPKAATTKVDGESYESMDGTEQKTITTKTDVDYYVSMDGTKPNAATTKVDGETYESMDGTEQKKIVATSKSVDSTYESMDGTQPKAITTKTTDDYYIPMDGKQQKAITTKEADVSYEVMDGSAQKTKIVDKNKRHSIVRDRMAAFEVAKGDGRRKTSIQEKGQEIRKKQDAHNVTYI